MLGSSGDDLMVEANMTKGDILAMKETGIIMSGNHPTLILDETKTQTRRTWGLSDINQHPRMWECHYNSLCRQWEFYDVYYKDAPPRVKLCPYGQVGDRLWVRETWAVNPTMDNVRPHDISSVAFVYYIASSKGSPILRGRWRASIHMPRWASRILLEITDIRVQRLQEISIEDCIAEGISSGYTVKAGLRVLFERLWNSLNAKRGYGWEINPWVWVILFRLIKEGLATIQLGGRLPEEEKTQ